MSIFICHEVLEHMARYMSPRTLLVLYLTIYEIPGSESTRMNLENLIFSLCTNNPSEHYSIDNLRHEEYRAALHLFCDSRKKKGTPEMISRVRTCMVPLYSRVLEDNFPGYLPTTIISVSSLELIQKAHSENKKMFRSLENVREALKTGDRKIVRYVLEHTPKKMLAKKLREGRIERIFRYAIIRRSILKMVVNKISEKNINREHWIQILKLCCEKGKEERVLNFILTRTGSLDTDEKEEMYHASIKSGRLDRVKRFIRAKARTVVSEFSLYTEAVKYGHLELLKYAEAFLESEERSFKRNLESWTSIAILSDHLPILKHLHEKYHVLDICVRTCLERYEQIGKKSIYYIFEQCKPVRGKQDIRSLQKFLTERRMPNIATLQLVFEKFGHVINPFVMLKNSVQRGRRHYEFCRDRMDISKLTWKAFSILLDQTVLDPDYIDLDMFLRIKYDFSIRVPDFEGWWKPTKAWLLNSFIDIEGADVLEYFLLREMNQEERNNYLLEFVSAQEDVNESNLEMILYYTTNHQEAAKVAAGEWTADRILEYIEIQEANEEEIKRRHEERGEEENGFRTDDYNEEHGEESK